jgi:glutaredoxin 3
MANITLYQLPTCPFCAKVRAKLEEMNLKFEIVNVARDREDPQRKEIFEKSGVATVPVINIDGKWVGDSGKIIKYLEENLK